MKKWIGWVGCTVLATLVVAAVVQTVTLVRMPYQIMDVTMTERLPYPSNTWLHAPPTTAESRTVVMPSSDLLYSACLYDVSKYPLLLTAVVPDTYWSISGYATNTDNFFCINDRQVKSNPVEVVLVAKGMSYTDTGKAHVVVAPSDKGIVLVRILIPDKGELQRLMQVQKQVTCELVGAPAKEGVSKPSAEGGLSFEAAEYSNQDYGFYLKYPKDWKVNPGRIKGDTVFFAADAAQVPAVSVSVKEAASFTEALRLGLEAAEGTGINLGTEKEVTLVDGSKATAVKVDWKVMGYPGESYAVGVKKDNKWIIVNVTTVTLLSPYDEALFSEITNTLQFK